MAVHTVAEVGNIIHAHPQTVRKLIRDRQLRALQRVPGGRVLISDEDLAAYLESIRLDIDDRPTDGGRRARPESRTRRPPSPTRRQAS